MIYFLLRHDLLRCIILSLSVAGGNTQDMINVPWLTPWYIVRRQLGCIYSRVLIALQCFFFSIAGQFEPWLPRVPPLFTVVGVKAFHGSHELACKREARTWRAVGIPSFYFFGFGLGSVSGFENNYRIIDPRSLMADSSATGSTGGSLHSLVQVAGLSAHDRNLHHGPLFFFGAGNNKIGALFRLVNITTIITSILYSYY